ncbi:hypothetical protein BC835DRAFT_1536158 [Cytidiella melzeri]|nr:hypothetical protein BC835DRAFT_1536158 [Cytidiella melzeri]
MRPPSFADIRDRATKARDTGLNKFSETRDKYSSRSSKDIDWSADPKSPSSASSPAHLPSHSRESCAASVPRPSSPPAPPRRAPPIIRNDSRPDRPTAYSPVPPPIRTSAPARPPAQVHSAPVTSDKVDWANLSPPDKEVLFSWLDEFFERRLNITIPPRNSVPTVQTSSRPITPVKPVCSAIHRCIILCLLASSEPLLSSVSPK